MTAARASSKHCSPSSQTAPRVGCQEPTFHFALPYGRTNADVATAISETILGLSPDRWQVDVMRDWLAMSEQGKYVHRRALLEVPRQNGKTLLVELRIHYGVLFAGEKILYTAHDYSTVTQLFDRMRVWYGESANDKDAKYPDLNAMVARVRKATGKEAIFFRNGAAIYFSTRTKSSKRGYTVDVIIADESQELQDVQLKAILSTASAAPLKNPQYIFLGTPPGPESSGDVFAHTCADVRVLGGEDVCMSEWGVYEIPAKRDEMRSFVSDRDLWYRTNPALGRRIEESTVVTELATYTDPLSFAQERLGYFLPIDKAKAAIPKKEWDACLARDPEVDGTTSYGVKFSPDGSTGCICAAIKPKEGPVYIQVAMFESMEEGVSSFRDWLVERKDKCAQVAVDGMANAQTLLDMLKESSFPKKAMVKPSSQDVAAACSSLANAVRERAVSHSGQPGLDASVTGCSKRAIGSGGGWGFAGSETADATPAEAAALAYWSAITTKRVPGRRLRIG